MSGSHAAAGIPWQTLSEDLGEDADTSGGIVIRVKAAAALNVGDAVFMSAARTVNKSTTATDYARRFGVVVGGDNFEFHVLQEDGDVGEQAAAANKDVLVCVLGLCKVVAGGTIVAGDRLIADTGTAGRVIVGAQFTIAGTDFTVDSGATPVTSTAANGAIIGGTGNVVGAGETVCLGHAMEAAVVTDKIVMLVSLS